MIPTKITDNKLKKKKNINNQLFLDLLMKWKNNKKKDRKQMN